MAPAVTARLRLTEIFRSLQGEADSVGIPTIFVRLTGCPLRCRYCDTAYAFSGGEVWELPQILARVRELEASHACASPVVSRSPSLRYRLCSARCAMPGTVSRWKRSGALPYDAVDPRVVRVVDVKTPASGESSRNLFDQLGSLARKDQIKFVDRRSCRLRVESGAAS
jgi:7-carboxy-7-deazaguanine synthase